MAEHFGSASGFAGFIGTAKDIKEWLKKYPEKAPAQRKPNRKNAIRFCLK
jgi:hypothetical protein